MATTHQPTLAELSITDATVPAAELSRRAEM
jgi:hypothetical protein